jgi:hypothetical protein
MQLSQTAERPRSLMNEKERAALTEITFDPGTRSAVFMVKQKSTNGKVGVDVAGWMSSFVHTNCPDDERIQQQSQSSEILDAMHTCAQTSVGVSSYISHHGYRYPFSK